MESASARFSAITPRKKSVRIRYLSTSSRLALYLTPTDPSGRKCQRSPRRALHPVVAHSIRLGPIECTAAFLHCPPDRTPPIPAEHGRVRECSEGDGTVDGPDPRRPSDQNWVAPGCLKARCSQIPRTCQGADPWRTTSEPHSPSTCLQQPEGMYPGCFGPSHFRNDDPKNRTMHPRRAQPTYLTSLRTPDSPSPRRLGESILLYSRRDAIPWRIGHSIPWRISLHYRLPVTRRQIPGRACRPP